MNAGVLITIFLTINMLMFEPLKTGLESLKANNTELGAKLDSDITSLKADNTELGAKLDSNITSLRTELGTKLDRVLEKLDAFANKSAYLEGQMSILINRDKERSL